VRKYICTNLTTGDEVSVSASSRKAAHEAAQARWAGDCIEVESEEEASLWRAMTPLLHDIRQLTWDIDGAIDEVTSAEDVTEALDDIAEAVVHLRSILLEAVRAR
jgi:hypothetical protein